MLSASQFTDKIEWYENDGEENFAVNLLDGAAGGAYDVHAADMDGDGDLDVLGTAPSDSKIRWYENLGEGEFVAHVVSTEAGSGVRQAYAADLNGDGYMDVVSNRYQGSSQVMWYQNDGAMNFEPKTAASLDFITGIHVTDVDLDGDLDVVASQSYLGSMFWLENDGDGAFTVHTITANGHDYQDVTAADVDGDGDPISYRSRIQPLNGLKT